MQNWRYLLFDLRFCCNPFTVSQSVNCKMASSDTKKGNKKLKESIELFNSLEIKIDTQKSSNNTEENNFKNFQKENKDKLSAKEALGRDVHKNITIKKGY